MFIAWSWAATSSPSVSPFKLLDNHLLVVTVFIIIIIIIIIIFENGYLRLKYLR